MSADGASTTRARIRDRPDLSLYATTIAVTADFGGWMDKVLDTGKSPSRLGFMAKKPDKIDPQEVIQQWLDRDLTAAAKAGQLPPAFEVDSEVDELVELLAVGRRPILTGESGIGKTAVIYELVRRVHQGVGPPLLGGKRFLQFSVQRHASGLKDPSRMVVAMQRLVDALSKAGDDVVPYFPDMHAAHQFSGAPLFLGLAYRFPGGLLAEGNHALIQAMFEDVPELDQHYFVLHLDEPSFEKVGRIIDAWSRDQAAVHSRRFTPEALQQALHLSHRFLARSRQPRKVLDLLGQLASIAQPGQPITESDVVERFCATHKTPRSLVDPARPLDLTKLERQFSSAVLGQPEAVRAMVNMIAQMKAGLSDVRRPFGVFLFVGPTGVGKTHVAQLLAEYLFGSKERMVRLNMADYSKEDGAEVLFGNPEGYRTAQMRGLLTQRIVGHPFAVVLLDEFEKAHARVHDRFLQLVDEGCFINAVGESISCRSTIIVATTNAGAELYRGQTFGFSGKLDTESKDRELDRRLEAHFRFEFLNRFDQIVHFHPLTREAIRTIALRELEQLKQRSGIKQRRLTLEVDEEVLDWLAVHGYGPDHGARLLRRTIERHVTTALADAIVRHQPQPGSRIQLTVRGNRITARTTVPRASAPTPKEAVTLPLGTTRQVRTLDREGLQREATRLLETAGERLAQLEEKRRERGNLLSRMNEPTFWDRSPEKAKVLDRFRELDVAIRVEDRLSGPLRRLEQLQSTTEDRPGGLDRFARAVEAAATAVREWDERRSEEGASTLWLVVSNVDPLYPAGKWLEDVAEMELAWCRRVHLTGRVVAYEAVDDVASRMALCIEGPGASGYFAMEEGVHRLVRHPEPDLRVRVEIIPHSTPSPGRWPDVREERSRRGPLNLQANGRGRIDLPERGTVIELLGEMGPLFSHLLHDLSAAWTGSPSDRLDTARVYGEAGRGAVDHRSGAAVPRIKDVLKGRLDAFLEGWRQHQSQVTTP